MEKKKFTAIDRAFQLAWVHYWRKSWYEEIKKNLKLCS